MPRTVTNFLHYVNSDKYDGTVVHRNSDTNDGSGERDFVIQGGGFKFQNPTTPTGTISVQTVVTIPAIADEPGGGVTGPSNLVGTIAMAKRGPNTVTSQWFINQGNNSFLDNPLRGDGGFAAFGKVLGNGMNVVNAIGDLRTLTDPNDNPDNPSDPVGPNYVPKASVNQTYWDLPVNGFTGSNLEALRVEHTVTVNSVNVLNLRVGDFDRNGQVNGADLAILRANFGLATSALLDRGDADMDGDVDGNDLLLFQRSVGGTVTPLSSVPEPGAATLAAAGIATLGRLRRRRPAAN
jgi:cyclophilin family peptidyl-prolyl cis-trans isomerase